MPAPGPSAERPASPWFVIVTIGLVILAVVVAAAVLGPRFVDDSGGDPEGSAEPTHPELWDARVEPIADWVEDERDLYFDHPVEVEFMSKSAYEKDVSTDPDDSGAASEDAEDAVATLRALGLISGDVDLAAAFGDLRSEGSLAYYSPEEEKIYIRGTKLTPGVRVTLAHELTHTLQDQHFDLGRIGDPEFERAEGLRAIAEGDANRIEQAYVERELTAAERTAYEDESEAESDRADEALDASVPPVLTALFSSPYVLGQTLVEVVELLEDDDHAIDDLLADPPTEEEFLNPGVRGSALARQADVEVSAPKGTKELTDDTLGPVTLYLMLASRGSPAAALRAVDGWGGDRFVSYRQDGKVCASVALAGDDQTALDGLYRALLQWAQRSPRGTVEVGQGDERVTLRSCDPGTAAAATGEVSEDLLVVPAVRAQLAATFESQGAPPSAARCAANNVVTALPLETLVRPDAGTDPKVRDQIDAAVSACI